MTLHEFYSAVGGDYNDAIGRLRTESFIERFLRMFPQDNSMSLLNEAMAASDAATAFRAVHNMKGIALNLSLTGLAAACSTMTEALRGKSELPAEATALYQKVSDEYAKVSHALSQLEASSGK